MELVISSDQFIIQYTPLWMFVLLLAGLILFFVSKLWRNKYRENHQFGFKPSILFIVSFVFLIGGIHSFVYKVVFNKDKIILFNIQDFNKQLEWKKIAKVEYADKNQLMIFMTEMQNEPPLLIDLQRLDQDSMDKVKILIAYKLRQSQKPLAETIKKPSAKKNENVQ